MTDCLNLEMRDRLAPLAAGTLAAAEAAAVRAHLAGCAACAAESELLAVTRRVMEAGTPRVDTAAIVAALPHAPLRLVEGSGTASGGAGRGAARRAWRPSRQLLAAAASILLVVSVSTPLLRRAFDPGAGDEAAVTAQGATGLATAAGASSGTASGAGDGVVAGSAGSAGSAAESLERGATAGLTVAGGLGDLSVDALSALLDELDRIEATVAVEPVQLRKGIVESPEGR